MAVVVVLDVIVVDVVVFLFVVVVAVVKVAVVVVVVFVRGGVGALVIRVGVQAGIINITPAGFILLVDFDNEIVHGEPHHRNGFCHACGKHIGLCTKTNAFASVLETKLITMVSSTISISKLTSTIVVPHFSMGVCLICLACAVLWLRQPYGRVLNMFGVGRPMATASLWACA